jgi:hypothetical protein
LAFVEEGREDGVLRVAVQHSTGLAMNRQAKDRQNTKQCKKLMLEYNSKWALIVK